MFIYGDFDTAKTRQLNIQLKRCTGPGCKTEAEILEFFRDKFLVLMYNQVRFKKDRFHEASIEQESRTLWYPINTQTL